MYRMVKVVYANGKVKYLPVAAEEMYVVKHDLDNDHKIAQWEVVCE